jgi:anti-sigma regulatory factor (Ser/Thr protein kinase)
MSRVCSPIRIIVPADLYYREVVIRAVSGACKLVGAREPRPVSELESLGLSERFDAALVSAVSEIFNNVVIHGHRGGDRHADVTLALEPGNQCIRVRISDTGERFDAAAIPQPDLRVLPEAGMGLFIARSCVDRLDYRPGPPNVWHLTKCMVAREAPAGGDETRRKRRTR